MNNNGKFTSISNDLSQKGIEFVFKTVNTICEKSAQFVSNHTDILSVVELEKLFFILVVVLAAIVVKKAIGDTIATAKRFIYTQKAKRLDGMKMPATVQRNFFTQSAKNLSNKLTTLNNSLKKTPPGSIHRNNNAMMSNNKK